jgi:hypothetical protein
MLGTAVPLIAYYLRELDSEGVAGIHGEEFTTEDTESTGFHRDRGSEKRRA